MCRHDGRAFTAAGFIRRPLLTTSFHLASFIPRTDYHENAYFDALHCSLMPTIRRRARHFTLMLFIR